MPSMSSASEFLRRPIRLALATTLGRVLLGLLLAHSLVHGVSDGEQSRWSMPIVVELGSGVDALALAGDSACHQSCVVFRRRRLLAHGLADGG